jgi:Flp pilus assembly protein TadD
VPTLALTDLPQGLAPALEHYRGGDLAGARRAAEAILAGRPDDCELLQFLGHVCCRMGDFAAGATHLSRCLELDEGSDAARIDLARALIAMGALDEAEALCRAPGPTGRAEVELTRIRAFVLLQKGRLADSAACYEAVVESRPDDHESWNNLGNVRRESDDPHGAVEALGRAVALRPELAAIRRNLGGALADAGRLEDSLAAFEAAARLAPEDPALLVELSRALNRLGRAREALAPLAVAARLTPGDAEIQVEIGVSHAALDELAETEAAYRRAIRLQPRFAPAFVQLALLLESSSRVDDLEALICEAEKAGVEESELAFVRALAARRGGRLEEALALAEAAPPSTEPHRKFQLIGEIRDRLDDADGAFAAFVEMNRVLADAPDDPRAAARQYRGELEEMIALATDRWTGGWPIAKAAAAVRAAPVFLVGFPRSGTTLLDTILMGHPEVDVVEERPLLQPVLEALGGMDRLADLGAGEIQKLRGLYFDALDLHAPPREGRLTIDKMPLDMVLAGLIHRLFPDARFIFVERHPADVVLSCFITNFRLNEAMANFLDLEDAARFYDLAMTHWRQCRSLFALEVHDLRYEHMVADLEGAVRPLLDWLGLAWDGNMLDHRETALGRGYVSTASYAQVTEPVYGRAAGRWRRYRHHLEPVLPLLSTWAERLGYEP